MASAAPSLRGRPFRAPESWQWGGSGICSSPGTSYANGLFFTAYALISRHATRDLTPTGKDLRGIGKAVKDHVVLRHSKGKEAKRYNVLQKLAYVVILFVVGPLIVLTGLTMSPTIDTAFPWLLTMFGGRQAARTIHFIACFTFVGFIVIHVVEAEVSQRYSHKISCLSGMCAVSSITACARS